MPISPVYHALNKKKNLGIPQAMMGQNPAFLPANYGFNDLAQYEEQRRAALGPQFQQQIGQLRTGIGSAYDSALNQYRDTSSQRRAALSSSLSDTAQKQFDIQNPRILEDLNSRGLFSSPTAVANAQAQVQKELAVANANRLNEFDTQTRGFEDNLGTQRLADLNELEKVGTSAGMQMQQDALDAALDLRRGQLESSLQTAQANREEALARDLAKQSGRQGITQSLIGAGGGILGGMLGGGGGGFRGFGGLFGGGGGGMTGAATGQVVPGIGAVGTGVPAAGGLGLLPGLGLAAGGIMGYQSLSDKGKSLVAPLVNPLKTAKVATKAVKSVGKKVSKAAKKVFCFDAETQVIMEDGSTKAVSRLYIGANTKGGKVDSIRVSLTDDGTIFNYKGIHVTGWHAVYEEGKWLRVKDSQHAKFIPGSGIVWSICTSDHKVYVKDILFADEMETDDYEELTIDQSLDELNLKENLAEASNGF